MKLSAFCRRLDRTLNTSAILTDPSQNGLQIGGEWDIKRAAFAVDANAATIKAAVENHADILVVHHGLLWNKPVVWTGYRFNWLELLAKNRLALYAAHLPLDMHPSLGNNAGLLKMLGIGKKKSFGTYAGIDIGFSASFEKSVDVQYVREKYEKALGSKGTLLSYGPKVIKTVAAFSGGIDSSTLESAVQAGIDLLVTGEITHSHYSIIEDGKLNVLALGHYLSETVGVKSLMEYVKKHYSVETVFIDHPTGL